MNRAIILITALALVTPAFAVDPEEELFGERVYFLLGDKFETGNHLDYFCEIWRGGIRRNLHGYNGYCAWNAGTSRPMKVEGGKRYALTFKVFNEGMEKGHVCPENKSVFPTLRFTSDPRDERGNWKEYRPDSKLADITGVYTNVPPPAAWTDVRVEFTVPQGATMVQFAGYGVWRKEHSWGPYCYAEVDLKEIAQ